MQVRALFDFNAEPNSGELSLIAGELLTVVRQDVGDGWWEGMNEHGVRGLFPESYVEKLSPSGPPNLPPPALPSATAGMNRLSLQQQQQQAPISRYQNADNGWGSTVRDSSSKWENEQTARTNVTRTTSSQKPPPSESAAGDDFDDDWSEDDSVGQNEAAEHALDGAGRVITSGGGVKKSLYRFSKFVQSGMEGFILNQAKLGPPPASERVEITLTKSGPIWASNPQQDYTCRMISYKKQSKLKGLKSFISYELQPSFAQSSVVSRRYKHFDWLHGRMEMKFPFLMIPQLPEKQMSGRFEEDFVEHRMRLLQLWVDKICRHPIMSRTDVWMHFMTCHSEESKEWKKGKRKAERDEYIGGNFLFAVSAPAQPLDPAKVEQQLETFTRKAKQLEEAIRMGLSVASESVKHMCGNFRREYLRFGEFFQMLSQATMDETRQNTEADALAGAIKQTGDRYDAVAKLYAEQPKYDLEPMMDELYVYKGMLAMVPHIAQMQKNVLSRLREHQKLAEEGKMAPAELETIRSRVDIVSYAMLAEINHFEQEHVRDIKQLLKNFLSAQIVFYGDVRKQMEEVVGLF